MADSELCVVCVCGGGVGCVADSELCVVCVWRRCVMCG